MINKSVVRGGGTPNYSNATKEQSAMIFTTIPFTYLIRWSKHDINYYGVRYARGCKPEDLWTRYFTSSDRIQECRELYGEPDIIEVRKTFKHHDIARAWEHRVLTRINAVQKPNWLNEHAGGKKGFRIKYGTEHQNYGKRWTFTEEQRQHQVDTHKNLRWWNNGTEQSFSEVTPGPDYKRGRLPFNNRGAKIGAKVNSQKYWITNGTNEEMIFKTDPIPAGYAPGRIESVLKGKTNHARGTHWWTDGTTTKMSEDCPGPEWRRGRTTWPVHSHS